MDLIFVTVLKQALSFLYGITWRNSAKTGDSIQTVGDRYNLKGTERLSYFSPLEVPILF